MPPHSASLLSPDGPLNEEIMEDITRDDRFQKKPTNLTEVVKHLPDDVFEKRPFRAYMAALQVRNRGKKQLGWRMNFRKWGGGIRD